MTGIFERLLKGAPEPGPDDRKYLTFDPADMAFTVIGYSADEVRALFTVYREHVAAQLEYMQSVQTAQDAVRYRPDVQP